MYMYSNSNLSVWCIWRKFRRMRLLLTSQDAKRSVTFSISIFCTMSRSTLHITLKAILTTCGSSIKHRENQFNSIHRANLPKEIISRISFFKKMYYPFFPGEARASASQRSDAAEYWKLKRNLKQLNQSLSFIIKIIMWRASYGTREHWFDCYAWAGTFVNRQANSSSLSHLNLL